MNIIISGKNMEVTSSLSALLNKKLSKLKKFLRTDTDVHVLMSVDTYRHICEITIPYAGVIIRAEESTGDMYASIDGVIDKLIRQIERCRTRLDKRWRGGEGLSQVGAAAQNSDYEEITEADDEDDVIPKIVRTKRFAVKPLMLDEAALQFQLLDHDFFVFRNAETQEVNVLYKRRDGTYGLIEPAYDDD